MKNLLFRDDQSLLGLNWYSLSKRLFVVPSILSFIGLLAIYSLIGSEYSSILLIKHILYIIISINLLIFLTFISKDDLRKTLNILAILFVILLIFVPILGYEIKGATRWINLKIISIQPSEILKGPFICFISWFSYLFIKTQKKIYLFSAVTLMSLVVALLLLQPDIGTLLVYIASFFLILILYFRNLKLFFLLTLLGMLFVILAYSLFDHVQIRIENFLFNENSQVSRSLNAIQSGGIFGVGLGEGQLKYSIPESHNDFIFAILIEEFGLIFGIFVAFLYPLFFVLTRRSSYNFSNLFLSNTVFSLCFLICIQAFINIGSAINLIPPTGMTLPFISYGGSSMLSYAIIFGTVINFTKNEKSPIGHPS